MLGGSILFLNGNPHYSRQTLKNKFDKDKNEYDHQGAQNQKVIRSLPSDWRALLLNSDSETNKRSLQFLN